MSTSITPDELSNYREALGHYASGLTVIASLVDAEPVGFTCQSFHSVSMNPPLVAFNVMSSSASYPKIRQAGRFAVNILAADQVNISNQFAQRGTNKWRNIEWQLSRNGNPFIAGSLYWIDCDLYAEHAVGDHFIVIGRVNHFHNHSSDNPNPLLYFKGQYCGIDQPSITLA